MIRDPWSEAPCVSDFPSITKTSIRSRYHFSYPVSSSFSYIISALCSDNTREQTKPKRENREFFLAKLCYVRFIFLFLLAMRWMFRCAIQFNYCSTGCAEPWLPVYLKKQQHLLTFIQVKETPQAAINDFFFFGRFLMLLLRIKGQANLLRLIFNHFQTYDLRVVTPQMLHATLTEGLQQQQLWKCVLQFHD